MFIRLVFSLKEVTECDLNYKLWIFNFSFKSSNKPVVIKI